MELLKMYCSCSHALYLQAKDAIVE